MNKRQLIKVMKSIDNRAALLSITRVFSNRGNRDSYRQVFSCFADCSIEVRIRGNLIICLEYGLVDFRLTAKLKDVYEYYAYWLGMSKRTDFDFAGHIMKTLALDILPLQKTKPIKIANRLIATGLGMKAEIETY